MRRNWRRLGGKLRELLIHNKIRTNKDTLKKQRLFFRFSHAEERLIKVGWKF